ncbi:AraC-like DNA-binding protein [Amycolatopsis bartoniae]|nr:helix-turn-helix transcriptional regulator [Amycolatopsis bartoniae]MBB2933568.1 AraC-like DNA-binding protein [Amycolatopsis bartoniae]
MTEEERDAARVLGPHLVRVARGTTPRLRVAAVATPRMVVGTVAYGCEVAIDLQAPQEDYFVVTVLSGRLVCRHGDRWLELRRGEVLAASPVQLRALRCSPGCLFRIIRIRPDLLLARLAPLLAFPPEGLVSFRPLVRTLRSASDPLVRSAQRLLMGRPDDRLTRYVEEVLVDWLVRAQPHQFSSRFRREARDVAELVAFVRVLMDSDPFGGRSMSHYAQLAGVSLAELTAAFQEEGCLPHEYLRAVRLDCVQRLLARAGQPSVRAAAEQCGFRDNALFNKWYYQRFGEWPWQTARRGRAR